MAEDINELLAQMSYEERRQFMHEVLDNAMERQRPWPGDDGQHQNNIIYSSTPKSEQVDTEPPWMLTIEYTSESKGDCVIQWPTKGTQDG